MKKRTEKSGAEILNEIDRSASEIEWTDEELDGALRENGVDPDRLVKSVLTHVRRLIDETAAEAEPARPLLRVLKDETALKPQAIAEALGVTVVFISDLNRHVKEVPRRWLTALARRAHESLGVAEETVIKAFEQPFRYARAASRDEAYTESCPTCEEILERSGMSAEAQKYWTDLLREERG